MTEDQYARRALSELVQSVFSKDAESIQGMNYETLAFQIGRRSKSGRGVAIGMGRILGKMGHMLQNFEGAHSKQIPRIQSLVINKTGKNRGLPADGIKEFWSDYKNLTRQQKEERVRNEYKKILAFGTQWNEVLKSLEILPATAHWIVKSRNRLEDGRPGWEWEEYFGAQLIASNKIYDWGGPDWIKSHKSRAFIRDCFREGGLVVCYQVEQQAIIGFSRLASDGYTIEGVYCGFDLVPCDSAYKLKHPLNIANLRATGCNPVGFTVSGQGTIASLTNDEFAGIIAAVCRAGTEDEDDLLKWLKQSGSGDGTRPPIGRLANPEYPEENTAPTAGELDKVFAELEKRFAGRTDIYVRRKVSALIRRDGPLIRALKEKYKHKCQFPKCSAQIPKKDGGNYSEVAHIQAASEGGISHRINLLVLCPNHHKTLDYGDVEVLRNNERLLKIELNGEIVMIRR